MRFSRFFIDRPIFAAVVSIVIFIAGLIAMFGPRTWFTSAVRRLPPAPLFAAGV